MADWSTGFDETNYIWSGKTKLVQDYAYSYSIGEIIFEKISKNMQDICQISADDGHVFLNQDVLTMGIRIALNLKKLQLNHESFVGICASNSKFLMPLTVGCYFNCTPFHAINPNLEEDSIAHCFNLTKPKLIFCDGRDYDKLKKCTKDFKPLICTLMEHLSAVPQIEQFLQNHVKEHSYKPERLSKGGDQTVAILCSSGTTGPPKAVCISNQYALSEQLTRLSNNKDIAFSPSGLNWLSGFSRNNASLIQSSTRIITAKPCTSELFADIVQQYNVSYIMAPPEFIKPLFAANKILIDKFVNVKNICIGGAPMSLAFLKRTQQIFVNATIIVAYGCTECGIASLTYGLSSTENNVGHLAKGFKARIVDIEGKNLAQNQQGEVLLYNSRKWLGYLENAAATRDIQDEEGWFHTGDIGYFDEQNQLHIVDRKKEICKYMGCQYAPSEIEAVIAELPEVISCCACGVYEESCGDKAGAVVVKTHNSKLTEKDIKQYVAKRLPAFYKQLHAGVLFVESLPQNVNGKVIRKQAQTLLMNAKGA